MLKNDDGLAVPEPAGPTRRAADTGRRLRRQGRTADAGRAAAMLTRVREVCRGRSLGEIAALTGVPEDRVRGYLSGMAPPSGGFLSGLCLSLGLSGDWLLSGQGVPFREGSGPSTEESLCECMAALGRAATELDRCVRRLGAALARQEQAAGEQG